MNNIFKKSKKNGAVPASELISNIGLMFKQERECRAEQSQEPVQAIQKQQQIIRIYDDEQLS